MFLQPHKTTSIFARAISSPRSLVFLLMVVGSASLLTGCVKSENELNLRIPMEMKCGEKTGDSATVGDAGLSHITVNLADYLANGPIRTTKEEKDPHDPNKTIEVTVYEPQGAPIRLGASIESFITSTTSNSQIGAGPELRVNQNAFRPESISYTIIDDKYKLGKISDKPIAGHYITGTLNIAGVTFLSREELEKWQKILPATPKLYTITIEAQIKGTLIGGTTQKTNSVRFPLELVANYPGGAATSEECASKPDDNK